ncbi:MAG: SprT-like domain-containing protein [Neisseriaceae bacterium]
MNSPTIELYNSMQLIYNHFNDDLFSNQLPQVLLTYQRHNNKMGYFSPNRWISGKNQKCHEISINPSFVGRASLIEFMQTLVHEMVHCWQQCYGKPSRNYHNKEWANKMISVGLIPSDTGLPGGTITGKHMCDYPEAKGKFIYSCEKLLKDKQFSLPWVDMYAKSTKLTYNEKFVTTIEALTNIDEPTITQLTTPLDSIFGAESFVNLTQNKTRKLKLKYTCPECKINVWGRPELNLMCSDCKCTLNPNI